jgi:antitoxin YefM
MRVLTISNLRKNIKKHFEYVADSMGLIVLPKSKNEDGIVIMSLREYNSLKETGHLLSTLANRNRLEESIEQIAAEDVVTYTEDDIELPE